MDNVVLCKIESLQVRTVQETGLKVRLRGRAFSTGTILTHLDDGADAPANLALIDLAAQTIKLQWAVIAVLPALADAVSSGQVSPKDSAPVRVVLEESGRLLEDGTGFNVKGTGQFAPGSLLSPAAITAHVNLAKLLPVGGAGTLKRAMTAGNPTQCKLVPESSRIEFAFPKSMGGGSQTLNLTGGFSLRPIMTLGGGGRSRR
jgi:hypothetical protein